MTSTYRVDSFELVSPTNPAGFGGRPHAVSPPQTSGNASPSNTGKATSKELETQPSQGDASRVLWDVYTQLLREDPFVKKEAVEAYHESKAYKDSDKEDKSSDDDGGGMVNRRAPLNPLASPRLGKFRQKKKTQKGKKVFDPALKNNPLRGRLVMLLTSSAVLLFIFWQSLCLNKTENKSFYAPRKDNSLMGPAPNILLKLGGLNVDRIRNDGETFRIFWAMWMHAGWIHILLNVISQLQYLFMFEPDWGLLRVLVIYFVSGVTGNLVSAICNPCTTTVGSSGALFGLMGAMIPYCLEFWNTIPRPAFLLCFSIIVLVISLVTGFTTQTDNWAHMGGLLGGIFSSLATVPTSAICAPLCSRAREVASKAVVSKTSVVAVAVPTPKKVVRRGRIARMCQKRCFPRCRCGRREWLIRIVALCCLIVIWTVGFVLIFSAYDYTPPGQLTFSGIIKCVCCRDRDTSEWLCKQDSVIYKSGVAWRTYCDYNQSQPVTKSKLMGRSLMTPSLANNKHPQKGWQTTVHRTKRSMRLMPASHNDGGWYATEQDQHSEVPKELENARLQLQNVLMVSDYDAPERNRRLDDVRDYGILRDFREEAWLERQNHRLAIRNRILRRFLNAVFAENPSRRSLSMVFAAQQAPHVPKKAHTSQGDQSQSQIADETEEALLKPLASDSAQLSLSNTDSPQARSFLTGTNSSASDQQLPEPLSWVHGESDINALDPLVLEAVTDVFSFVVKQGLAYNDH